MDPQVFFFVSFGDGPLHPDDLAPELLVVHDVLYADQDRGPLQWWDSFYRHHPAGLIIGYSPDKDPPCHAAYSGPPGVETILQLWSCAADVPVFEGDLDELRTELERLRALLSL